MNSPPILSYLSTYFFPPAHAGQRVELPQGQKSPVLKCFVGPRQELHISNLSRCIDTGVTTQTPPSNTAPREHHTDTSTGTKLLKPHHCSPKRSWDVQQWMWNTPMASHAGLPCHRGSGTELCWGHKRTKPHLFSPGDDCSCPAGHTGSSVEQGCWSWAVFCVCWMHKVSAREVSSH